MLRNNKRLCKLTFFGIIAFFVTLVITLHTRSVQIPNNLPCLSDATIEQEHFQYDLVLDQFYRDSTIIAEFDGDNQTCYLFLTPEFLKIYSKKANAKPNLITIPHGDQQPFLSVGDTLTVLGNNHSISIQTDKGILYSFPLAVTNMRCRWFAGDNVIKGNKISFKKYEPKSSCDTTITQTEASKICLDQTASRQLASPNFENYTFSFFVYPEEIDDLKFLFCSQDYNTIYYELNFAPNSISLVKSCKVISKQDETKTISRTPLATSSLTIRNRNWQQFKVCQLNGLISVFHNHRLILQAYDPTPLVSGDILCKKGNKTISMWLSSFNVEPTNSISLSSQIIPILQAMTFPTSSILLPENFNVRDGKYSISLQTESLVNTIDKCAEIFLCYQDKTNYIRLNLNLIDENEPKLHMDICIEGKKKSFTLPKKLTYSSKMTITLQVMQDELTCLVNNKVCGYFSNIDSLKAGRFGISLPQDFTEGLKLFEFSPLQNASEKTVCLIPISSPKSNGEEHFFERNDIQQPLLGDWTMNFPANKKNVKFSLSTTNSKVTEIVFLNRQVELSYNKKTLKKTMAELPQHIQLCKRSDRLIIKADDAVLFNIPIASRTLYASVFTEKPLQQPVANDGKEPDTLPQLCYHHALTITPHVPCHVITQGLSESNHQLFSLKPLSPTMPAAVWFTKNLPEDCIITFEVPTVDCLQNLHIALNTSRENIEKNVILYFDNDLSPFLFQNKKMLDTHDFAKVFDSSLSESLTRNVSIFKIGNTLKVFIDNKLIYQNKNTPIMNNNGLIFWSFNPLTFLKMNIICPNIHTMQEQLFFPRADLPSLETM